MEPDAGRSRYNKLVVQMVLVELVALVVMVVPATALQTTEEPPAPPVPYSFSYVAGRYPGHVDRTHSEAGDGSGRVYGSYAYVDPRFQVRQVDYVADEQGFHPVLSNPVADTPVVAGAKLRHEQLFQSIAAEHARIAAEREAQARDAGQAI
ncbi:cuticle protein 16.8 isoform X2 [Bacillus rossius redtenbacheri]|uniref:cuticle protein 16.8 isoform X2 n=1 Tax=Bacillus rossius redtenbacheri TaxID=93214 RepID=UPI002FDD73AB